MDVNYRELSFASPFLCLIKDGNIFDAQNNHIGVTLAAHKEALDLLKNYKSLLEEHGIIQKQKSPEELQKEMQMSVSALTNMVQSLTEKIERLESKNDKQGSSNEPSVDVSRKGQSGSSK
jgi:hypothetical protein